MERPSPTSPPTRSRRLSPPRRRPRAPGPASRRRRPSPRSTRSRRRRPPPDLPYAASADAGRPSTRLLARRSPARAGPPCSGPSPAASWRPWSPRVSPWRSTTTRQRPSIAPCSPRSPRATAPSTSRASSPRSSRRSCPSRRARRPLRGLFEGAGSGIVLTADGLVLTNAHVIGSLGDITVVLNDGSEHPATLVGSSPDDDLAVIQVRGRRRPRARRARLVRRPARGRRGDRHRQRPEPRRRAPPSPAASCRPRTATCRPRACRWRV